jgi:hypothetical protein
VRNDIVEQLHKDFPHIKQKGLRTVVILNGIEPGEVEILPIQPVNLHEGLSIDANVFVFGLLAV